MTKKEPSITKHVWDAILNDSWMWVVVWGKQRCGKTTFAMQVAYEVYKDWDKVLQSFVFNLSGLMYKTDHGQPERIWTRNQLHNRVPFLIFDDWGGTSNKAATQHSKAWDIFKGAFDLLGTELAVLFATMVDPTEPTMQLQNKYTHEVWIKERGVYKYDIVDWRQDYYGWIPKKSKDNQEENIFHPIPEDVYKEYDEMRMSLVPEVKQRMRDAMAMEEAQWVIKRLLPSDIDLLETLRQRGQIQYQWFYEHNMTEALIRAKARDLVVTNRLPTKHYAYDISDLGLDVLARLKEQGKLKSEKTEKTVKAVRAH